MTKGKKKSAFALTAFISKGLNPAQLKKQLKLYGPNHLKTAPPPKDWYFFIQQFKNPLVFVLLLAAIATALLGHFSDSLVITLAILINTILGFLQERKAFKSVTALRQLVSHEVDVVRSEKRIKVPAENIVPGDIVYLYEGDKVPADGVVLESHELLVAEAVLTGESLPVEKIARECRKSIASLDELLAFAITDKSHPDSTAVFMGSTVTAGAGVILATQTGMSTKVGQIAADLDEFKVVETPLEKRLGILANHITKIIVVFSAVIFLLGVFLQKELVEMFTVAVALAVAAIPEGLVVGLTAILAVGMNRILRRKGLVKSLLAAETLGSVTTVCLDKTGTVTEGRMKVVDTFFTDDALAYLH